MIFFLNVLASNEGRWSGLYLLSLYVQYSQSNISVKQNTFLCISMRAKSEILLPKVIEHTPS